MLNSFSSIAGRLRPIFLLLGHILGNNCGFKNKVCKCGETPIQKVEGRTSSDPLFFRLIALPGAPLLYSFSGPGWAPRTSTLSWRKTTTHCPGFWPPKQVEQTVSSAHWPFLAGSLQETAGSSALHINSFNYQPHTSQLSNSRPSLPAQFPFWVFWLPFSHLHVSSVHSKSKTTCADVLDNRVSCPKSITWFIVPFHPRSLGIDLNSSFHCYEFFLWNFSCLFFYSHSWMLSSSTFMTATTS